jgi:hypothetical protein
VPEPPELGASLVLWAAQPQMEADRKRAELQPAVVSAPPGEQCRSGLVEQCGSGAAEPCRSGALEWSALLPLEAVA